MSRYIDADKLHYKKVYIVSAGDCGEPIVKDSVVVFAKEIDKAVIQNMAPIIYAEWSMYSYDEAICSHCGYDRMTPFECTSEAKEKWHTLPKFCENCGAKMTNVYEEDEW